VTATALRTHQFFIGGEWVEPSGRRRLPVQNPATRTAVATVALGDEGDVDRAVSAARDAFAGYAAWPVAERANLLRRVMTEYAKRQDQIAELISLEMGCPITTARESQAPAGLDHFASALRALKSFDFEQRRGTTLLRYEPIGVCALITPWNWPVNQIAAKVAPALAAGCAMVLKPSELAPLDAIVFAEILDAAGVPAGVVNLVQGDGPGAGRALAAHPDVDMVSFTGSTRGGVDVAAHAAGTVKRVAQELGGKSAHVVLPDADVTATVAAAVRGVFDNAGQSCDAAARILVPSDRMDDATAAAREAAAAVVVGDPADEATDVGPVVSERQYRHVQRLIESAIAEGAHLVAGGAGHPAGLERGWFVRPTVFADVNTDMLIAQEEVFGPVALLLPYRDVDDAVRIANDSMYGLSGRVTGGDHARAVDVARRLRTGMVYVNDAGEDLDAPFGGYRRSGNGREYGEFGLREYLEVKAILGGASNWA
jgi:aldehyde dehydrogenase (NAD+)